MAKKQAIKIAEPEEDISQEVPDEEPARVIEEDDDQGNGSGFNKTKLIHLALNQASLDARWSR